ncbi:5-formyltetrahydrofolate cyclo-ligase [Tenacibaculum adriaticum]|uniref:5-formyltetrahydrofolate cyclo-ligase n=1 Tax=Tenacibaculum adriaticum TaxID=413713 RepID=A0A5S5DUP5_9FLAO|nr:5-formyltetrahydrofolate cyclo-ligase [Tenacibaculum adriaticum]TYP99424.1 5-formyltetrahydrofolate cyclo-ligase [Tenacibaculum adriaticum]
MRKQDLRKQYKQKRKNLKEVEIDRLQKNIYQQLFKFDFSSVENIHIFLPIERQKEINTYPIISFLRKLNKTIIISKTDFSTVTLQHFLFEEETQLETNTYGIPEPINAKKIDVKDIDLVFVPLLISDEKNYRVGYGKGFYDRFLSECSSEVKTIGLNFFEPIKKIEDINEFDVPLQTVIYPK